MAVGGKTLQKVAFIKDKNRTGINPKQDLFGSKTMKYQEKTITPPKTIKHPGEIT